MMPRPLPLRSAIPGLDWPPVADSKSGSLAALVSWLDASQWLAAEELADNARKQLALTAANAVRESPYFAQRMRLAGLEADDLAEPAGLSRLPPMTRRNVQDAGAKLFCQHVPASHLPVVDKFTSGSTGEPIRIKRTATTGLFWNANALRDHLWHRRDFTTPLAVIRANLTQAVERLGWGPPVDLLFNSGPVMALPMSTPVTTQAARVRALNAGSLLTYPNNLALLIDELAKSGPAPETIRHVRTIAEMVSEELRAKARGYFTGLDLEDMYSSEEAGIIAVQCADCGRYHVMAETLLVEVVNDAGMPCREGEVGRLLISDLTNFATPIIRYEIGDYAEAGGPSTCGRGLPVLNRIVGRERNLVVMPDGTRQWPLTGFYLFHKIAPVQQYQFVQVSRDTIEVNLVVPRPLTPREEAALKEVMTRALGHAFKLVFRYSKDPLQRGPNGKFEDFVCRVGT
jgi:phenylacetate-CoA ligase